MWSWLRQHQKKLVVTAVVMVPLVMMVSSAGADIGESSSGPTRVLGGFVGTVQAGIHNAIGGVGGLWNRMSGGGEVAEENDELRREVDRLREEKTRLIGVLQENARLREMVEFRDDHSKFELAPAKVVGRDVSPYFRVMSIQIESQVELEERMPVVASDGVVGQIHRVYDGRADVVLATDPRSRIDAVSQRNRTPGVVEGLGDETDYRAAVAYVDERDDLAAGDRMVTSGMGGVFPRELALGTVVDVERDGTGLFQEITLEPSVDFSRLEEVFVITGVE